MYPDEAAIESKETKELIVDSLRRKTASIDFRFRSRLARCGDTVNVCNLPMCPLCVDRLARLLVFEMTRSLLGLREFGQIPMSWLSADLSDVRVPIGELSRLDLLHLNRRISRRYDRVGFPLTFSSVRLVVIAGTRKRKPMWQARVDSLIIGALHRRVEHLLIRWQGGQLPRGSLGIIRVDDVVFAAIKPVPYQVTAPDDELECMLANAPQQAELARWLAQYQISDRYALTGLCWADGQLMVQLNARASLATTAITTT